MIISMNGELTSQKYIKPLSRFSRRGMLVVLPSIKFYVKNLYLMFIFKIIYYTYLFIIILFIFIFI